MAILTSTATKHNQSGIALAISLVFLLLMTIIGVSAMSTSALQEKMAGNLKDKHWSFNASESAVMAGERVLCLNYEGRIPVIDPTNTTDGLYRTSITGIPVWQSVDWAGTDVFTHPDYPAAFSGSNFAQPPRFIIEEVQEVREGLTGGGGYSDAGKSRMMYRVTGRGVGGTANAVSMVQTTFAKK